MLQNSQFSNSFVTFMCIIYLGVAYPFRSSMECLILVLSFERAAMQGYQSEKRLDVSVLKVQQQKQPV